MCDAHGCPEPALYVWEVPKLAEEAAELGLDYHRPKYCATHSVYAENNPEFRYVGEVEKES